MASKNGASSRKAGAPSAACGVAGGQLPAPDGARSAAVAGRQRAWRTSCDRTSERRTSVRRRSGSLRSTARQPARRFTFGTKDQSPRWSPDGRYLAFLADRGEKTQIFLAPLDGGEAQQLTKEPHGVNELAWSPDGEADRVRGAGRRVEGVEGSQPDREGGAARHQASAVSTRRRRLLRRAAHAHLLSRRRRRRGDADHGWRLVRPAAVMVAGRQVDRLLVGPRARTPRPAVRSDAWVVASTGGRARKLTRSRGAALSPSFSPDGRFVAFVGPRARRRRASRRTRTSWSSRQRAAGRRARSARRSTSRSARAAGTPLRVAAETARRSSSWCRNAERRRCTGRASRTARASKVLGGERQIQQFSFSRDARDRVHGVVRHRRRRRCT